MALLARVLADYRIDRRRILVTGFSLGRERTRAASVAEAPADGVD
jgi:predicted peptidase